MKRAIVILGIGIVLLTFQNAIAGDGVSFSQTNASLTEKAQAKIDRSFAQTFKR